MLFHYDKTRVASILDACLVLATMLYEKNNAEINFINLAQVVKRKTGLSKKVIQHLMVLKNTSDQIDIKLACCILLEARLECEEYLEQMEASQKESFQKYPIINLY
jgi:hypothetical protein